MRYSSALSRANNSTVSSTELHACMWSYGPVWGLFLTVQHKMYFAFDLLASWGLPDWTQVLTDPIDTHTAWPCVETGDHTTSWSKPRSRISWASCICRSGQYISLQLNQDTNISMRQMLTIMEPKDSRQGKQEKTIKHTKNRCYCAVLSHDFCKKPCPRYELCHSNRLTGQTI